MDFVRKSGSYVNQTVYKAQKLNLLFDKSVFIDTLKYQKHLILLQPKETSLFHLVTSLQTPTFILSVEGTA